MSLKLEIPGLTESNRAVSLTILPYTKKIQQVYKSSGGDSNSGDLMYIGFENGEILSLRFILSLAGHKIKAGLAPQNIYKAQTKETTIVEKKGFSICSLSIDPVTDWLLAGSVEGTINVLQNTILRMVDSEKAKAKDEEQKAKSSSWKYRIGLSEWAPFGSLSSESKIKPEHLEDIHNSPEEPISPASKEVESNPEIIQVDIKKKVSSQGNNESTPKKRYS